MQIEIWSDVACPWCYIGKRRFERALAGFPHRDQVDVVWRSYQLDPSIPDHYDGTELDYLAERKGMPRDQVRRMFAHVADLAAGEGLAFDFERVVVANSYPAHELIHLAAEHGVADRVKEALLSAHFEHGEDIGSRDLLRRIGTEAGLSVEDIDAALDSGRLRDDVAADIARAGRLGIAGVPFVVVDGKYGVSGAQPVEVFSGVLEKAWADANPIVMVDASDDATTGACGPDGCAI